LTISHGGAFLKPILIAKGKTERCLKKFNINKSIIGTYTKSSWANENCILLLLDEIYKVTNGENSVLLLDKYDSHKTDKVMKYAKCKNIHLIYVPKGMTAIYQPLDTCINGIIKEKAIQKFSEFKAKNPNKKYNHEQCLIDIIKIKKSISKKTIIRSFSCLNIDHN
jgi:hypothetical protein